MDILKRQTTDKDKERIEKYIIDTTLANDYEVAGGNIDRLFAGVKQLFLHILLLFKQSSAEFTTRIQYNSLNRSYSRLMLWYDVYQSICSSLQGEVPSDFTEAATRYLKGIALTLVDHFIYVVSKESTAKEIDDLDCDVRAVTSLIQEFGSDDDNDSDNSSNYDYDSYTEIAEDLKTDTTCLVGLNSLINRPSLEPRVIDKASSNVVKQWEFYRPYCDRISNRFPNGIECLISRLGIANYDRYLRRIQRSNEADDEPGEPDETESIQKAHTVVASAFHDSGLGSSVPSNSSYAETIMSYSAGGKGQSVRVPPLSEEAKQGVPFSCIACSKTVSIKNNSLWKRHLYDDLCPWMCLDPDCPSGGQIFTRRNEWIAHLSSEHRLAPAWASFQCPLCRKDIEAGKTSIVRHLGDHLEEIALGSLPIQTERDEEVEEPFQESPRSSLDPQPTMPPPPGYDWPVFDFRGPMPPMPRQLSPRAEVQMRPYGDSSRQVPPPGPAPIRRGPSPGPPHYGPSPMPLQYKLGHPVQVTSGTHMDDIQTNLAGLSGLASLAELAGNTLSQDLHSSLSGNTAAYSDQRSIPKIPTRGADPVLVHYLDGGRRPEIAAIAGAEPLDGGYCDEGSYHSSDESYDSDEDTDEDLNEDILKQRNQDLATNIPQVAPSPERPPQSDQPDSELWDSHKETLQHWYIVENLSLGEIGDRMRKEHDFNATIDMYKYFFQRWNFHMINMTEIESHLKQRAVPLQTPLFHHEYDPQDDNYEAHYDRVEDSTLPPNLPQDLSPTDSKTRMSELKRQLEGSLRTIVSSQAVDLAPIRDQDDSKQVAYIKERETPLLHQEHDPQDDEYAGNYAHIGSSAFPPNLPQDLPTTLQFPGSERPVYNTTANLTGISTGNGYSETEDFRKSICSDEDLGLTSTTTPAPNVTSQFPASERPVYDTAADLTGIGTGDGYSEIAEFRKSTWLDEDLGLTSTITPAPNVTSQE